MKAAFARIAKALGILCGVSFIFTVGLMISGSWINPLEKAAMQACLTDIEKVREFKGASTPDYYKQVGKAEADLEVCKRRAFTIYDHQLLVLFEMRLSDALREQRIWQLPDSNPAKSKMLDGLAKMDESTDRMLREKI